MCISSVRLAVKRIITIAISIATTTDVALSL
jgi:hypothetical protein